MKRTISVLLAAVLLLGVMGACGEKGNRSGIWYELAGIDPQAVAVEADGVSLPAELYCYWFVFNASMMEYRAYLYADEREEFANIRSPRTRLNWDAPFGNGTVLDYVLDETMETIRFYMTVRDCPYGGRPYCDRGGARLGRTEHGRGGRLRPLS